MKRVGILYHPVKEATHTLAKELEEFLTSKGLSVWLTSAWDSEAAGAQVDGTDLILSIGGDGTILRAAQVTALKSVPIVGINLGNLGFMTELSVSEAREKLLALLAGKGWIDERSLLEAELFPAKGEPKPGPFYALNDVVVARSAIARLIHVEASIGNELLTIYKADGVIVATATGSTGYALAAGGPILYPQSKEILLLPIAPHLSSAYRLVLPSLALIRLRISTAHSATLSIDGHINLPISVGDVVTVKGSSATVRFLRIKPEDSFYSSLEQKLKGKE
ncbi:MAG: NAD(+)/NADH kinase [Dehalococcoidales bacterium]|nr:NAD(+)/NADH kinase [Dehalococcoidales bacterium]